MIATTGEMFREFERRYGDVIPSIGGDFTPYWEDGAGSTSRETAMNRASAERLMQAETYSSLCPIRVNRMSGSIVSPATAVQSDCQARKAWLSPTAWPLTVRESFMPLIQSWVLFGACNVMVRTLNLGFRMTG